MIDIVQAEKKPYTIDLISKEIGKSFDMTGFIEIVVCFISGSTIVEKKETTSDLAVVGDPKFGQLSGSLSIAETDSLPPTTGGNIEVRVEFSAADHRKAQKLKAFTVSKKLC